MTCWYSLAQMIISIWLFFVVFIVWRIFLYYSLINFLFCCCFLVGICQIWSGKSPFWKFFDVCLFLPSTFLYPMKLKPKSKHNKLIFQEIYSPENRFYYPYIISYFFFFHYPLQILLYPANQFNFFSCLQGNVERTKNTKNFLRMGFVWPIDVCNLMLNGVIKLYVH